MQWSPLPMMAHGKVTRSFLPLDRYPSLKLSAFYKNLYFGDEVFLFESNSENWARGYQIVHPLPSDFIAKSSDLEKLPERQVSVVIVPLSHVEIIDRLPATSIFSPPSRSDFDNGSSAIPSVYDIQQAHTTARNADLADETPNERLKPPLPLMRLDNGHLMEEVIPSLSQLASHIYSLYSVAEYPLFENLYDLFIQLNDITIQMRNNLLTKNEKLRTQKRVSLLLTNVSKLLSSKGVNRFDKSTYSRQLKSDTSGFESITARDIETGELFDYSNKDLKKQSEPNVIALNQISSALQPNFPIKNNLEGALVSKKVTKFDKVTPSQILVDFKDVSGTSVLNPQGFMGMTAYLYLRSAKKRLTEAFSIHIKNAADFSLDKISAALFRNIPGTEIDHGRIYLVATITEELEVPTKGNGEQPVKIKNPIAAGAADISRIFSRHKGALESGQAHQFTIKLFGSYVNKNDNTTLDPTNMNFGWGDLVDRIIAGSNKGVAVNPRAEKVVVSIKEYRDDLSNVAHDFDANIKTPIYQIRTCFFDPLVKAYDRIYLTLGKVNLLKNSEFPGDLLSLTMINNDPESRLALSKATDQLPVHAWDFPSVHSNEVIGETIKISNIERIGQNQTLKLKLYANFELRGTADIQIAQNGKIFEYNKNQIVNIMNGQNLVGSIEVTSHYVGKTYNIEPAFQRILGWSRIYTLPDQEDKLIETLKMLNQTPVQQAIKYFKELCVEVLRIFHAATVNNLDNLKLSSFYSFIHLLDLVVVRQEQYTYMYHQLVDLVTEKKVLPRCGIALLSISARYFGKAGTEWNYVSRTLCRVLPLLVKISLLSSTDNDTSCDGTALAWKGLSQSIIPFLQITKESMIPDQLNVLDYLDITLNHLKGLLTDDEVLEYAIALIGSVGTRGLVNEDSNSLISKEKQIYISKLFLIRRFLDAGVFSDITSNEWTERFFYHAALWSIESYASPNVDVEIYRLANSCLISLCSISWRIILKEEKQSYSLPRSIARLSLVIAQQFVKAHNYCRTNGLFEPKRTYTNIFPNAFPFPELITDSTVSEVVLVEVLVELGIIYSFMVKIGKHVTSGQGYSAILTAALNDHIFNESEYFVKSFSKDDLLSLVQTNRILIQSSFFPSNKWISLYAVFIEGATTSSELIKFIMICDHIPSAQDSDQFDRSLWSKYIKSLLTTSASFPASICHLAEVPRKAAWKITQDIRSRCASVLNQCWDCLGWDSLQRDYVRFGLKRTAGYQAEFIQNDYGILDELVVFCLQRNSFCQIVGVKVLWSIMISELLVQESCEDPPANKLIDVERGCLMGLDKFFNSEKYVPGLYEQRNFIARLKMAVKLDPEDESFNDVYSFIQNLSEFLEIYNDLNSVPNGEEYDDERTFHNLDISRHLMRVSNGKKFISALDDMYESNIQKNNFVQAALCLELMASTFEWNPHQMLPSSFKPKLPAQTAFERKELLYKRIAENLIKGNKLEKAVLTYKELADAYDKVNFDLKGLNFVHTQLASLFTGLEALDRATPTYFAVSFLGLGFPKTVRSRSFIYEGLPFEQISSIHNRLLRLHSGSKIVGDKDVEALMKHPPPGKFLNIATVKPHLDFNSHHGKLSSAARLYMQNKDLKFFTTSRMIQKSTSVLDLWVEEIIYETYDVFPTLMNRSEIYRVHTTKLSPILNALRTLTTKTQDLVNSEAAASKAISTGESRSSIFNELSRNLSGTVDSPVNGGIGQYREFFNQPVDPEDEDAINEISLLRSAFENLTITIHRSLIVHGHLVPDKLRESHALLISMFEKNFAKEIASTGLKISELENALPPPQMTKTHSMASTIETTISSSNSTDSLPQRSTMLGNGNNTASSSRVSSISHGLSRVSTKSSDNATTSTQTTQSNSTSSSGGRRKFSLQWRQSRQ